MHYIALSAQFLLSLEGLEKRTFLVTPLLKTALIHAFVYYFEQKVSKN